ncbi:MAG TPA: HAD family hydrolase [Chthoniobacterales bacterium]
MSSKALIFDVDGTLVDSVDLHAQAWQDGFREFGKEVGFAEARSQIGKGSDTLLPAFLNQDELAEFGEALTKRRGEIFKERYLDQVKPFPQVRELFEHLRREHWKVALASSGKADEVEYHQKLLGIKDLVDVATSSADAEKSKPHPDIFAAALGKLELPSKEEIVVIGDTPYDVEAAGKAGLRTLAVRCGGFAEEELRKAGAVGIYQDPADLLARYEEWSQAVLTGGKKVSG